MSLLVFVKWLDTVARSLIEKPIMIPLNLQFVENHPKVYDLNFWQWVEKIAIYWMLPFLYVDSGMVSAETRQT